MDVLTIVSLLTPLVVWGVTELVQKISASVDGKVVLFVVVPAITILTSLVASATVGASFWGSIALGLVSVAFDQALKLLKGTNS